MFFSGATGAILLSLACPVCRLPVDARSNHMFFLPRGNVLYGCLVLGAGDCSDMALDDELWFC